jgi:suppressor for copper-sensitivity B
VSLGLCWIVACLLALTPAASEAQVGFQIVKKAKLQLALDRESYAPGDTVRVAAVVVIDENWHIQSHQPSLEYLIPSELSFALPEGWPEPTIEWPPDKLWQSQFEAEPLAVYDGTTVVVARLQIPEDAVAGSLPLDGELYFQACDDRQCVAPTDAEAFVALTIGDSGREINQQLFDQAAGAQGAGEPGGSAGGNRPAPRGLFGILLLGVLGGLILNAMPCVLPVLSLKVFGLIQSADEGRGAVVKDSLASAAGILVSFWLLALAAIAARSAGNAVGWGIQFQNPVFVTILAVILVLFCLNLWGLFEIPLPRRIADRVARSATSGRSSLGSHFSAGLFATLMATPCSAPFLGTAVGFGLSQTAPMILAVFTAIGVGMALPYFFLAAFPGGASLIPHPGAWMEQVKGIMGFLLAGTALWLFYVLANQVNSVSLALIEGGLLLLALGLWLRATSGTQLLRTAGLITATLAIAFSVWIAHDKRGTADASGETVHLIEWQDFAPGQPEKLAADGRLVFVDVTADWCATCKVNERLVLETEEIDSLFEQHDVLAMKADWTNRDDDIAQYLAEHGRYAIPFYVLYRPGQEPHLFGELLSKKELIRVINESGSLAAGS